MSCNRKKLIQFLLTLVIGDDENIEMIVEEIISKWNNECKNVFLV